MQICKENFFHKSGGETMSDHEYFLLGLTEDQG